MSIPEITNTINNGIDRSTNANSTIDYEHHEIHAGSHYYISNFEDIDEDGTVDFAVTTPDTTKWLHMIFIVSGQSETEFNVYEGAEVSGGTSETPINNNRNLLNTSDAVILKNPTVSVLGTEIFAQSKGKAGATPSRADDEGMLKREREIILKQNTTYVFRITSRDDGNTISYIGEWYEHTNK